MQTCVRHTSFTSFTLETTDSYRPAHRKLHPITFSPNHSVYFPISLNLIGNSSTATTLCQHVDHNRHNNWHERSIPKRLRNRSANIALLPRVLGEHARRWHIRFPTSDERTTNDTSAYPLIPPALLFSLYSSPLLLLLLSPLYPLQVTSKVNKPNQPKLTITHLLIFAYSTTN